VGSKRRIFVAIECVSTVQGHPRSTILVPIESAYATAYKAVIVTLVIYCTVTGIRRLIGWEFCVFLLPLSHLALPLPMFSLVFRGEESWGNY